MKKQKIFAIANQKGGVGKTTTALNLGAALAKMGKSVLLIDLDPQGNLSSYLGWNGEGSTIADMLSAVCGKTAKPIEFSFQTNEKESLSYIPADESLIELNEKLASVIGRESVLRRLLMQKPFQAFDIIIIDCPPTLSLYTINALAAASGVIIPVQTQDFALDGITQFEDTFGQVKSYINPALELVGILPTMAEHTVTTRDVLERLDVKYKDELFQTRIGKYTEATDSVRTKQSMVNMRGGKLGAKYIELAHEVLTRVGEN